jgi:hypothetical protein
VRSVFISFLITHIIHIVPIIVVFTKYDTLVNDLELEARMSGEHDETALEARKVDKLDELCIQPLKEVAGSDILHTTVSSKGVLLLYFPMLTYNHSGGRVREHHKTTDQSYNHER